MQSVSVINYKQAESGSYNTNIKPVSVWSLRSGNNTILSSHRSEKFLFHKLHKVIIFMIKSQI